MIADQREKLSSNVILWLFSHLSKNFAVGDELSLLLSIARVIFKKTALYERELLLAANEEKERSLFERWETVSQGVHGQRVAPFPNLPRKDNNGENKATGTQSYKYLQVEQFFQIAALLLRRGQCG